jgi:hypothetical protein
MRRRSAFVVHFRQHRLSQGCDGRASQRDALLGSDARHDVQPTDRFSQTFDLTFDLSVADMLCWWSGGCLCVPTANDMMAGPVYSRSS